MRIEIHCLSCLWRYVLRVADLDDFDPAERDVCPACGGKTKATVVNQVSVR